MMTAYVLACPGKRSLGPVPSGRWDGEPLVATLYARAERVRSVQEREPAGRPTEREESVGTMHPQATQVPHHRGSENRVGARMKASMPTSSRSRTHGHVITITIIFETRRMAKPNIRSPCLGAFFPLAGRRALTPSPSRSTHKYHDRDYFLYWYLDQYQWVPGAPVAVFAGRVVATRPAPR